MDFGPSLSLSLKQQLKLNTKMLQSLQLMTLPLTELQQTVNEMMESNPTLSLDAPKKKRDSFDGTHTSDSKYVTGASYEAANSYNEWMENAIAVGESLQDHLNGQLGCTRMDDKVREVAEIIISNLDKKGFHAAPPSSILKGEQLKYLPQALKIIQSLDPIGCGVQDYKESLIVQAKALGIKGDEEVAFKKLVNKELEKMRAGKKSEVCKDLNCDEEDLNALFEFLQTLTPYPGLKYSSSLDEYIIPDLSIKKEGDELVLKINTSSLPNLSIDASYEQMAEDLKEDKEQNKEAIKYLKNQLTQAKDLIEQVQLRNSTLEKVGVVLLDKQKEFFLYGTRFLKPLILKDVAEIIGVHETTVSRITTSKYIDTDFGIFPIKMLFSTSVQSEGNEEGLSKTAVKDIIKEIIEEHTGPKALSDQKISDILNTKGIKVARRTVAKYRKELDIDSSFIRG